MTILFEPITTTDTSGAGRASILFGARGRGFDLSIDQGIGRGHIVFGGRGRGDAEYGVEDPIIPAHGRGSVSFGAGGIGAETVDVAGGGGGTITFRGHGYGLDIVPGDTPAAGRGHIVCGGRGRGAVEGLAYGFAVERPAIVGGYGGMQFASITESLAVGGHETSLPIAVLREALAMRVDQASTVDVMQSITEAVTFGELLVGIQYLLIEEGIVFGSQVQATPLQIARIVERLLLAGAVDTYVEAIETIVVGLVVGTIADGMQVGTAEETVLLDSTIAETVTAMARLVETLLVDGQGICVGTVVAIVREGLVVGGGHGEGTVVDIATVIREAVSFVTRLSIDNGEYIAWVLNTESKGLSRYTQFPFNSFARIGGKYFAADSTGLHRMQGDTDSGEQIHARLRLGLMDMGTRKLKRLPEVFFALSGGSVFVQVITVAEDGEKEAAIYRMKDRPAAAMRENRVKFGRGMKGIDWDFVLENIDGASVDIKKLEFRPVILDRRTRG